MFGRLALGLLLLAACNSKPPCQLAPGPPGYERFSCPDGSSLIPLPGEWVPPGAVHGVAQLFGQDDSSGVKVALESGFTVEGAYTDAAGGYDLNQVVPGPYLLQMGFPAYTGESLDRFLVLPGTTVFNRTTLYMSRNVMTSAISTLTPSPALDTFAIQGPGLTGIFDVRRFSEFDITADSDEVKYSRDSKFLFVHEQKGDNRLLVWNVAAATERSLAADVLPNPGGWKMAPDDRSVALMDSHQQCEVWDEGIQRLIVLGTQCEGYLIAGNVVLALVQGQGTGLVTMWSLEDHSGASLGPASNQAVQFKAKGPTFAYFASTFPPQWLVVFHGKARALENESVQDLSDDGLTMVVRSDIDGSISLEDVQSGRKIVAASDGVGSFLSDGTTVALFSGDGTSLTLLELSGKQWTVVQGRNIYGWEQLGDGRVLGLRFGIPQKDQPMKLLSSVWTPDLGLLDVAEGWGTFTRTPDGTAVVVNTAASISLQELSAGKAAQILSSSSMLEMAIAPDGQRVAFREGCSDCVRGDLRVFDRQIHESTRIATGVADNYKFTKLGSLLFVRDYNDLAQLGTLGLFSPCAGCAGGGKTQQLLERVSRQPMVTSESGGRALAWKVPVDGYARGTLFDLHDPSAVVATPVDEAVLQAPVPVLTEKYLAFANGSDIRPGLFITSYPAETPFLGAAPPGAP